MPSSRLDAFRVRSVTACRVSLRSWYQYVSLELTLFFVGYALSATYSTADTGISRLRRNLEYEGLS